MVTLPALLLLLTLSAASTADKPVPELQDRVTDLAKVFSAEQRTRLIEDLATYELDTSNQLAVLTVPKLSGEPLEEFSLRVAKAWALGQKGKDNGILVTLALEERQVRIELGKGLESEIPQATLNGIIQDVMIPDFKQGDYAGGLEKGVQRLKEVAPRPTTALHCDVDVRVVRVVKNAKVDAEIAEALSFDKEAIGRFGVTHVEGAVVSSKPTPGKKDNGCAEMVDKTGDLVVRYELSDTRAETLIAGKVVHLRFFAMPGFPLYGVPGAEVWMFP